MKWFKRWLNAPSKGQLLGEIACLKTENAELKRDMKSVQRKNKMLLDLYLSALNSYPEIQERKSSVSFGTQEYLGKPIHDPIMSLSDQEYISIARKVKP